MERTNPADEYLHRPADARLWNESYYFGFGDETLAVAVRTGFQPYERRANVWFYVVDIGDATAYVHRDENVPLEAVHGLHVDTEGLTIDLQPTVPTVEWSIEADGYCHDAGSVQEAFLAGGSDATGETPVELDLTFRGRNHSAYTERRNEDKQKTTQAGHFEGRITVDGTDHPVDAAGFRDHSWGGQRNWTPLSGGYLWFTLRLKTGDAFKLAAYLDGEERLTTDPIGYHADGADLQKVDDVTFRYPDDVSPETRLQRWLDGELPAHVDVTLDFGGGTERLVLEPLFNTPLGYEDRNWATATLDSGWLTSVVNRLPVTVTRDGDRGGGWLEAMHPRSRGEASDLGSAGL